MARKQPGRLFRDRLLHEMLVGDSGTASNGWHIARLLLQEAVGGIILGVILGFIAYHLLGALIFAPKGPHLVVPAWFRMLGPLLSVAGLLVLALAAILFVAKARYEERLLMEKFVGYYGYCRATPRFIPLPWRARAADSSTKVR